MARQVGTGLCINAHRCVCVWSLWTAAYWDCSDTRGEGERGPGPATQLAKGYASLFQKTLRKGLYFGLLYVLDYGKKGPFFRECQQFRRKGSFFCSLSMEKGYFPVLRVSVFWKKKRGLFSLSKYQ